MHGTANEEEEVRVGNVQEDENNEEREQGDWVRMVITVRVRLFMPHTA